MAFSFWQLALVALIFLLLFGKGKIPALMGDVAQGIKNFKNGIRDETHDEPLNLSEPVKSHSNVSSANDEK